MKRVLLVSFACLTLVVAAYFLNRYWVHRFDASIARQAAIYRLDPDLIWSIMYEETYFSPWKMGKDGEIGLMQITPAVGREWAAETGMKELERQMGQDPVTFLRDPQRNIQVGAWYLEKIREQFRDQPDVEARMIAGYNAGPSRAVAWNKPGENGQPLSTAEFINNIDIPSTRAYVLSIMQRYRALKGNGPDSSAIQTATPAERRE